MGGHGGLNILPQKRWNVYNYENREKVRRDEEEAAKEEQLKREQARKRDAEFRLERLRAARGLAPLTQHPDADKQSAESEIKTGHINLFEGSKIFDPIKRVENGRHGERDENKRKKMKKDEQKNCPRVINPEDEKYRLGYGIAGKGVKLPWYLEKRRDDIDNGSGDDGLMTSAKEDGKEKKSGKKTLAELREERLKREKREKERQRALIAEKSRRDGGFSRR